MKVAIFATHGETIQKIGWIETTKGGVYLDEATLFDKGSHHSYHSDGSHYLTIRNGRPAKLPSRKPFNEIKGLETLYVHDGPKEQMAWPYYLPFNFKRVDVAIYVDTRGLGEFWHFGVGLLELHAYGALEEFKKQGFPSIHLTTSSIPWLVVGHGPSQRNTLVKKRTAHVPRLHREKHVP